VRAVAGISSGAPRSMGRSTQGASVERDQEVPDVHGAAEDRDRARVAARPQDDERAVSRARDRRQPAAQGGASSSWPELLRGMGVSMRVARSRELVAQGRPAAVVARVAGISRQAIYRRPSGRRRASAASSARSIESCSDSRTRTRPMGPAWSRRSPGASSGSVSIASGCSG
jgi:hypothetical protein